MSTEAVVAAREAVEALILDVGRSDTAEEPAVLIRVGRLATRVAAAEGLARRGDEAAGLLATGVLREIARDFPERALPPLDLLAEERAHRAVAVAELAR